MGNSYSRQFNGQKQHNKYLLCENPGQQQNWADENETTTTQLTIMMVSQRNKMETYLVTEYWVDVFSYISNIELAQTVSLTIRRFNEISRKRLDEYNKRIVPPLRFSIDGNGMAKMEIFKSIMWVRIPIAEVPPPINILGFRGLNFRYIDDRILEFVHLIKPNLGTNICLFYEHKWNFDQRPNRVHQLYNRIKGIIFSGKSQPNVVHQLCNIIKGNVSELRTAPENFICLNMEFLKTIQFAIISAVRNNIDEVFFEWMHSPLEDSPSRYVFMFINKNNVDKMAKICKKRFLESVVPVPFVIYFFTNYSELAFRMENHKTGEQLTLELQHYDEAISYYMLCRTKIGDNEGWRQIIDEMRNVDESQTKLQIEL